MAVFYSAKSKGSICLLSQVSRCCLLASRIIDLIIMNAFAEGSVEQWIRSRVRGDQLVMYALQSFLLKYYLVKYHARLVSYSFEHIRQLCTLCHTHNRTIQNSECSVVNVALTALCF